MDIAPKFAKEMPYRLMVWLVLFIWNQGISVIIPDKTDEYIACDF
jgi:hypothetical protein